MTVAPWASEVSPGPPDERGDPLRFTLLAGDPDLFAVPPAVDPATGALTFLTAPDANGATSVDVVLDDGTAVSAVQSFAVAIVPRNDPPSFAPGPDQTVVEDAGPQTRPGWAGAIDPGAPDEDGDPLGFQVVAAAPGLFSVQPTLDAAGTLTFTPAPDTSGSTTVDVTLSDGTDPSPIRTFTIAVAPLNDPPVAADDAAAVDEDTSTAALAVLANDTDADADSLTITSAVSGDGTASTDGTTLSYFRPPTPPARTSSPMRSATVAAVRRPPR